MMTETTNAAAPSKPGRKPRSASIDAEAKAITICHAGLKDLDKPAALRVIEYVKGRLGLS